MADNRNQVSNGADQQGQRGNQQMRGPQAIMNSGRQIQGDVQQLATHVQETSSELQTYITEQVRDRPYTVLGAAAAVGFLLGGGLSSKLTLMAFGVATRLAMAMAAKEMGNWATAGFEGMTGGGEGRGGSEGRSGSEGRGGGNQQGRGQQRH